MRHQRSPAQLRARTIYAHPASRRIPNLHRRRSGKMCIATALRDQFERPTVEASEDFTTETAAFKGNDPVSKVAARRQHHQPGLRCGTIYLHAGTVEKSSDEPENLGSGPPITPSEHPGELAQRWQRHCD